MKKNKKKATKPKRVSIRVGIQLGDRIRDNLTGLTGIAAGRCDYLTGCTQFGLAPEKLTKEGMPREWLWLDESRLSIVALSAMSGPGALPSGGPQPKPVRATGPRRF
jgi:hypothetical protein